MQIEEIEEGLLPGPSTAPGATAAPGTQTVNVSSVILFFVVACTISWPFFWWRDMHNASWVALPVPVWVRGLAPGLGPALGALLALVVFRKSHRRTISLLGTSASRSFVFALVPLVAATAMGVGEGSPHRNGALFVLSFLAYGLLEEAGWRGFLQDALRPLRPVPRYILAGTLWNVWHFTTFTRGAPREVAIRLALLSVFFVLGAWGIGTAADTTGSLTVAALVHLSYNFWRALPPSRALPFLAICAVCWFVLLKSWRPGELWSRPAPS